MEAEKNLNRIYDNQRDNQVAHLKDKLADRRRKKLAKLRQEQEQELGEVRNILI